MAISMRLRRQKVILREWWMIWKGEREAACSGVGIWVLLWVQIMAHSERQGNEKLQDLGEGLSTFSRSCL